MAESASELERVRAMLNEFCLTRDVNLRNQLVQEFLYIAQITARRFSGRGVEYDDLVQVASLALINALDRFECSKNVEFASFATPTVVGAVKNYFRDRLRLVRLPRRSVELARRVDSVREQLVHKLGRNPTSAEIADELRVPLELVIEAMESRSAGYAVSLDQTVGDDDSQSVADTLGTSEQGFESVELNDFLRRELDKLDDTERRVILARFVEERSQRDVAQELGVSQMYISRLERRVLDRLRKAYQA